MENLVKQFIEQINQANHSGKPYFGIFPENDRENNEYDNIIKANKYGVLLFVKTLLTATFINDELEKQKKRLNFSENFHIDENSATDINYIQIVDDNYTPEIRNVPTGFDYGCLVPFIIVLIFIFLVIVGVITVFSWI